MGLDFSEILVIGVSSRALFDLEKENEIFDKENIEGFRKYQLDHEDEILNTGTAFPLIQSLLQLNKQASKQIIEIVVMSRNSPETGARVLKAIKHYNLPLTRWAFSGGEDLAPLMDAFDVDLFLSRDEKDVQWVIDNTECAAALIFSPPTGFNPDKNKVKFAFDADAVVFSEESELIYKTQDLAAFHKP